MIESSITKKGQTTLPKPVRETLGVQAGDRVRYVISNGGRSPDQSTVRHATAQRSRCHRGGNGAVHSRRSV
jgi:AbrB family looped-hinge helix DNA binding protein